mgnify:CR=1 FL=1
MLTHLPARSAGNFLVYSRLYSARSAEIQFASACERDLPSVTLDEIQFTRIEITVYPHSSQKENCKCTRTVYPDLPEPMFKFTVYTDVESSLSGREIYSLPDVDREITVYPLELQFTPPFKSSKGKLYFECKLKVT